ncbi:MAG: BatA domain-containing protein [Rubripirellula sp.]
MSFVQAGFLIACAAVAIPVLVHLLSRWQVRTVELGTMKFLQEVIHDGAQRRKIRRWLLLLTRIALCALLALLFARPFLPERIQRDGDRLRIVLIDRSASMGMPGKSGRLIDDAVGAASSSLSDLGSDAKVLWAWFDRSVHPMPEDTSRPSAPRAVVGDTNYLAALSWARDRIDSFPDALADVVLVTDLQQSGLSGDKIATESLGFPSDIPVRVIDVGRPAANNLAITNVATPATRLETEQDVKLLVTLFNYGTLPFEEVSLTAAAFDGSRTIRLKKSINIPEGQAEETEFDFGKLESGTWQVTVGMDVNDDLASDNRRLTAIEIAQPVHVMVLDSGSKEDGVASESYYLVTALEQDERREKLDDETLDETNEKGRGRFHAEVVYLEEELPRVIDPQEHPLVVVADAASVSAGTVEQLESYVSEGGKLLVFAGDGDIGSGGIQQIWGQAGLAPGEIKPPQFSGAMPFRITAIDSVGTMLRPFADPQHGDLSRLAFSKLLPVTIDEQTKVHAKFDHGRPALTEHRLGAGRVVWFLTSADGSWGNWTTSPLYLPLVQQMAGDLLNLTGEGPIRFRTIGDELPDQNRLVKANTVALKSSDSESGSERTFGQPGFDQRSVALFVVNGLAKESDPTRMVSNAFFEHFQLTPADASSAVVSASVVGEKRNELWPWLAAALFVLLVGEFCLANRTSA